MVALKFLFTLNDLEDQPLCGLLVVVTTTVQVNRRAMGKVQLGLTKLNVRLEVVYLQLHF